MDTWTAIDTVRVVRRFADRPIEPDHLRRILDAARRTGSSKNDQDWAFIVVRDRDHLGALAAVGPYAGHLATATVAIALVVPRTDDRWDLGRAAQDMVLAAWELGIGSVPATVYDLELASRLLDLPDDWVCPYLLSFGYPADPAVLTRPNRAGGRKTLAEVVHVERWGTPWSDEDEPTRRLRSTAWMRSPPTAWPRSTKPKRSRSRRGPRPMGRVIGSSSGSSSTAVRSSSGPCGGRGAAGSAS